MPERALTPKSVRIADDEAKWLSVAATKGGVTQNDLLRLALNRLRKELGAASRVKPEAVIATAKASKYKLTPPRAAANTTPPARRTSPKGPGTGKRRRRKPLDAVVLAGLAPPEPHCRSAGAARRADRLTIASPRSPSCAPRPEHSAILRLDFADLPPAEADQIREDVADYLQNQAQVASAATSCS